MGTQERKQRERAGREKLILRVGRRMLIERGYLGLNMDRIAEEIEYSKGIVYQHFSSKEDLLCAMTIELLEDMLGLFRRAAGYPGRTRERLTATAVAAQLEFRLHPDRFQALQIVWVSSIAQKASAQRQAVLDGHHAEVVALHAQIIDQAVREGELVLPRSVKPARVVYGMMCMIVGAEMINRVPRDDKVMGSLSFDLAFRQNLQTFLDGLGWKPLSTQWDYEKTVHRVLTRVFHDEWEQLKRKGQDLI